MATCYLSPLLPHGLTPPFLPLDTAAPSQAYNEWDQAARRLLDARLIQAAVVAGVGAHPGTRSTAQHACRRRRRLHI